ncbi:hypothetical protein [Novipirellula caenicola]|uniref:Uncharacterized protein n=1 Tax=Novipirellula caenicola TaxID=1536901 RepID=A0ABP9VZY6_9BACT
MPKMAPYPNGDTEPVATELPHASVPIGKLWGHPLALSYWVLFATAAIAGVITIVGSGPGNQDLALASLVGSVVWIVGWFIQAVIYAGFAVRRDVVLSFSLVGIGWHQGAMTAKRTSSAAIATLAALVGVGAGLIAIAKSTEAAASVDDAGLFAIPGLGMTPADSMLHFSGWLFWLQAVGQLYPLRMTLGRHLIASLIVTVGPKLSPAVAAILLHRMLLGISLLMVGVAIATMRFDQPLIMPRWPLFLLLAFALIRTASVARSRQLIESLWERSVELESGEELPPPDRLRERLWGWFARRRARRALQREHDEAVDATKLDQILERLHDQGPDSLSHQDRVILKRVSESLKKHRNS